MTDFKKFLDATIKDVQHYYEHFEHKQIRPKDVYNSIVMVSNGEEKRVIFLVNQKMYFYRLSAEGKLYGAIYDYYRSIIF